MSSKSERFELRLNVESITRVDDWRAKQADVPSRSEAVRRLIDTGLGTSSDQAFMALKFQILLAARTPGSEVIMSDGFIYSWQSGVYPFQDDLQKEWAKPFAAHFDVKESEVKELAEFLDLLWLKKKRITFYELEDHYEVLLGWRNWTRMKLVRACRYLHLEGLFDEEFRAHLVVDGKCPIEAKSITKPFDRFRDIFLG